MRILFLILLLLSSCGYSIHHVFDMVPDTVNSSINNSRISSTKPIETPEPTVTPTFYTYGAIND